MNTITKAHKIKLNPTPEQEQYFWKCWGVAKHAWNWGLDHWNLFNGYNYKVKKCGIGDKIKFNGYSLRKEYTAKQFHFVKEVSSMVHVQPFLDLQKAFTNYWREFKKGTLSGFRKNGKPKGWPQYKGRKSTPSFYVHNNTIHFDESGYNFWFDKKRCGWVNMTEKLRFNGRILGGRISYKQGYWWLSVQVEIEHEIPEHNNDSVGIDFGIKYLAVTSDGEIIDNPKNLIKAQSKLRQLQRKLDRQRRANNPNNFNEDGTAKKNCHTWVISNKMRETERQITKLHAKIANMRLDKAHKLTTSLTEDYGIICIENLNINGMLKNHKLAKHIADAGWYEKRRQLEYKSKEKGGIVSVIDQWFPSSKLCSNPDCDYKNVDLTLDIREWVCPECNQHNHRDGNAAINIRNEGLRILNE